MGEVGKNVKDLYIKEKSLYLHERYKLFLVVTIN